MLDYGIRWSEWLTETPVVRAAGLFLYALAQRFATVMVRSDSLVWNGSDRYRGEPSDFLDLGSGLSASRFSRAKWLCARSERIPCKTVFELGVQLGSTAPPPQRRERRSRDAQSEGMAPWCAGLRLRTVGSGVWPTRSEGSSLPRVRVFGTDRSMRTNSRP